MAHCPYCYKILYREDLAGGPGAKCPACAKPIPAKFFSVKPSAGQVAAGQPPAPPPPMTAVRKMAVRDPQNVDQVEEEMTDSAEPEAQPFLTGLRRIDPGTAAAFCLGSLAICFASLPAVSFLSKPLSLAGLLLGLGVMGVRALQEKKKLALPLTAAVLCAVAVLFVGSWPRPAPPLVAPPVAIAVGKAGMVAHQPLKEGDWLDASTRAARIQDVRVQVLSAKIDFVELAQGGKKTFTTEPYLVIRVRASFDGVIFQEVPYERWADLPGSLSNNPPTLIDNRNQSYVQKTFASGWRVAGRRDKDALTPGHIVGAVLIYPVPPPNIDYLRLTLPASAFGKTGEFRFQVPRAMIEGSWPNPTEKKSG